MKVTAILGSPNKNGATSTMARAFIHSAKASGAETKIHFLNRMNYQGCQGCHACKDQKESCVLKDDVTPVLTDMQTSDVMVFATPVYYWDVSGQFKCFFDRTWSLVKPDYKTNPDPVRIEKGKKALLITSQGDAEDKNLEVIKKYTTFLTLYGYETHSLRAFDMGNGSSGKLDDFVKNAAGFADTLLK